MSTTEKVAKAASAAASATSAQVDPSTLDLINANGPYIASAALLILACIPIWIGSHRSVDAARRSEEKKAGRGKEDDNVQEVLSQKDAYMFPVVGSAVLGGMYILFKVFPKEWVNFVMTAYFLLLGEASLTTMLTAPLTPFVPASLRARKFDWSFKVPLIPKSVMDPIELKFNGATLVAAAVSLVFVGLYVQTKHWVINNMLGLSFSINAIELISLGSYKIGCIALGGLFFYDIFWVFGTDVMVTVARSFDAPIKLVFPKEFVASPSMSMLGLGDIIVPGIFVALLLRFDAHRARVAPAHNTRHSHTHLPAAGTFSRAYFLVCFVAYIGGLLFTMFIMHYFKAAQPALLYLVPACIGSSFLFAAVRGEVSTLLEFEETSAEDEEGSGDGKKDK
eukprot:TRINITY_DN10130_c0_g1_i1.p1 TRINITY_DN10130_c0_g1~~TRINITY_DN10130_c0_g1_i1.p1  ORF type:complete len:393 (-),score=113.91 TRINITY_DN10130_c0_g1_i1:56-1234(-)